MKTINNTLKKWWGSMASIKVALMTLALCLSFVCANAGTISEKDSLKTAWKPVLDLAVGAIEQATGKTSLYGIPYSFLEGILLLIGIALYLDFRKKSNNANIAAHQNLVNTIVDSHAKTVETLSKK